MVRVSDISGRDGGVGRSRGVDGTKRHGVSATETVQSKVSADLSAGMDWATPEPRGLCLEGSGRFGVAEIEASRGADEERTGLLSPHSLYQRGSAGQHPSLIFIHLRPKLCFRHGREGRCQMIGRFIHTLHFFSNQTSDIPTTIITGSTSQARKSEQGPRTYRKHR